MYRDGHIFLYSVRRGEVYTVYWEPGRVFFFLFVFKICFLVAMENVFERSCDI